MRDATNLKPFETVEELVDYIVINKIRCPFVFMGGNPARLGMFWIGHDNKPRVIDYSDYPFYKFFMIVPEYM